MKKTYFIGMDIWRKGFLGKLASVMLLAFLFSIHNPSLAQEISLDISENAISSAIFYSQIDNYYMDGTVGGLEVETFQLADQFYLSQGFLQPSQIDAYITFQPLADKHYGDLPFQLNAQASDGSAIIYSSSDTSIAKVILKTVYIMGAGKVTITAMTSDQQISESRALIIHKGNQLVTFNPIPTLSIGGLAYRMKAGASSGLPIKYRNSNGFVVRLVEKPNDTSLVALAVGRSTITASQEGDKNYNPASLSREAQVVSQQGNSINVSKVVTPNNDGVNDALIIHGIENFPDNEVRIYNREGYVVFHTKGYNNANVIFSGQGSSVQQFSGKLASSGAPLPQGVYFYRINYKDGNESKHVTGYFELIY